MRRSLLLVGMLIAVGADAPVHAQIDSHWGMQTLSHVDEHFDYWDRCTNSHYDLERRISYCKSILADGRHRRVAVLTEIGNAYFDARKYTEAVASYSDALSEEDSLYVDKLEDYRTEASGRLEESLVLSGQFDRAIDHVNTRIKNNPDVALLYNQRCWLRAIAGKDLEPALADCNEALKRVPDNPATLDSRGLVNFRLANMREAEADYDAVLAKDDDAASSLYVRGIIKLRSGNTDAGNEDIASAIKRDPSVAERFADYGVKP